MSPTRRLGLIGHGLLGSAIGDRTARTNWQTFAFDTVSTGGNPHTVVVDSLDAIADEANVVLVAVYSPTDVADVLSRLDGVGRGRTALCSTTLDPSDVCDLATLAARGGWRFVEYPVCGSSRQVRLGDSLGLVGADAASMASEVLDLVRVVTPRLRFFGHAGEASAAKLAVNLVLELNRTALAEGLRFAESLGIDMSLALEVLQASPADSAVMRTKGAKMVNGEFAPEGRVRQSLKDVHSMVRIADERGLKLPLLRAHQSLLEAVCVDGDADSDSAAVIRHLSIDSAGVPSC